MESTLFGLPLNAEIRLM